MSGMDRQGSQRLVPRTLLWLARHMPPSVLRAQAGVRFRKTVRWAAKHSPFYRKAFAARGIDPGRIRTPADLGRFFTCPEDLAADPNEFLCLPPSTVFESSSTSGKGKSVFYSHAELKSSAPYTAAAIYAMGITRRDRVANAFDFSLWIPAVVSQYGLNAAGVFSAAFGKIDPAEVYRRLERYGITVVIGEPTWLIRLTEIAESRGAYPLRFLVAGGEPMPPGAKEWMERVWAPAKVRMTYGSVELGGALGVQPCEHAQGYHLDDFNYLTELADVDADGYGEIVVSTLRRRVMPLIRYRTRDVARFTARKCPCGIGLTSISWLRGRRDEMVAAAGGVLYPQMFADMLARLPVTHDWQVILKREGFREVLEVNVEADRLDPAEARRRLLLEAADQYPDFAKNLGLGTFDVRLCVHPPATLRTGRKLPRIIDNRRDNAQTSYSSNP